MRTNAEFVAPRDALVLGNDRWEDDRVNTLDFEAAMGKQNLDPGDEVTALEIISNDRDTHIAVGSVGTTRHPHDIDNDGTSENAVRYVFEDKPDDPSDSYNTLPGLSTTAPFGTVSDPVELESNAWVGPMYSFRVKIQNRTDGYANPVSIPLDRLGVTTHARVIRGAERSDIVSIYGSSEGI